MQDNIIEHEPQAPTTEQKQLTKRAILEKGIDALDQSRLVDMPVVQQPVMGNIARVDVFKTVELGKVMATTGTGVPAHLRGNVGACIRLAFQSVTWQMDPFQLADMSYIVNDRLAYMSQLIHAVIEARAPLQHRLDCRYDGEGATRTCTVIGHFTTGDTREYTTPEIGKIRVKNSPLWKDDPDQQLFYFASRSWARKWCPDILFGVYTREELQRDINLGRDDDGYSQTAPGLHARLVGSPKSDEGHKPGHVDSELEQVVANGGEPAAEAGEQGATSARRGSKKRASEAPKGKVKEAKGPKVKKEPAAEAEADDGLTGEEQDEIKSVKTADQYLKYARKWIKACNDSTELFARWTAERKLRNVLGITADDRAPLDELIAQRREQLEN